MRRPARLMDGGLHAHAAGGSAARAGRIRNASTVVLVVLSTQSILCSLAVQLYRAAVLVLRYTCTSTAAVLELHVVLKYRVSKIL